MTLISLYVVHISQSKIGTGNKRYQTFQTAASGCKRECRSGFAGNALSMFVRP